MTEKWNRKVEAEFPCFFTPNLLLHAEDLEIFTI